MNHKNKNVNYEAMLGAGLSKAKIDEIMDIGRQALSGLVTNDEVLYFLMARYLGLSVQQPKSKMKYISRAPSIQLAQVKNTTEGHYVSVKGQILKAYDDKTRISFSITDMKEVIRCTMFGQSALKFRKKNFDVGDYVLISSIRVKSYRGKKELEGNDYTEVTKTYIDT
jgi:hypothetical protein